MSFKTSPSTKNDDIITTEKGRKIKRGPTSLHIDLGLWQEVRIMAVLKGLSVTDYVEDALRRKIDADNLEAGRQGYKVGQGGMYIPPPPAAQQSQPQPEQTQSSEQPQLQSRQGQNQVRIMIDDFNIPWDELTNKKVITTDGQTLGRIDRVLPPYARVPIFDQKVSTYAGENKYIPKTYHINKTFFKQYDSNNLYLTCSKEYATDNFDKIPSREEFERGEDVEYYKERYIDTIPAKSNEPGKELYELKDEKWSVMDERRRDIGLRKFIGKVMEEYNIESMDAVKLIMKQKDLLKRAADEIGTEDEARLYYWFKNEIDVREQLKEVREFREKRKSEKEKPDDSNKRKRKQPNDQKQK